MWYYHLLPLSVFCFSILFIIIFIIAVTDFTLVGIHAQPDAAVQEVSGMVTVYDTLRQHWNTEVSKSHNLSVDI